MHEIQYDPYTVVRDTREKEDKGWIFNQSGYCAGTVERTLDTGDYTIHGYDKHLSVERKGSVVEFAANLIQDRFEKELQRLHEYPWRYVILEFEMNDLIKFPEGTHIPKQRQGIMKLTGSFLLKRLIELQHQHNTPFLFCGIRGREVCSSIFKRFMENVSKNDRSSKRS
jgi:hypothetical protein